jgi:hypothetical protein
VARGSFDRGWLVLLAFALGFVAVVGTHPEPYSGWAVWALSPLVCFFVCLVVLRVRASWTALVAVLLGFAYAGVFALVAGLGDESYTDLARLVYLFLPVLGVVVFLVFAAVAGAVVAGRSFLADPAAAGARAQAAIPFRRAFLFAAALVGGWLLVAAVSAPRIVVSAADAGSPAPLVAKVRCEGDDTYLLTPVARTQADGVHALLDNRSGHQIAFEYEINDGVGGGGGEVIPVGVSHRVIPFKAQTIGVACVDERPAASSYATLVVRDPRELTREPQVDCQASSSPELGHQAPTRNLIRSTRRYFQREGLLRRSDTLKRATGPAPEVAVILVLRDDRAIAALSFTAVDQRRYRAIDATICD